MSRKNASENCLYQLGSMGRFSAEAIDVFIP